MMLENFCRYSDALFIMLFQKIYTPLSQRVFKIKSPPFSASLWKFQSWFIHLLENVGFLETPPPLESALFSLRVGMDIFWIYTLPLMWVHYINIKHETRRDKTNLSVALHYNLIQYET